MARRRRAYNGGTLGGIPNPPTLQAQATNWNTQAANQYSSNLANDAMDDDLLASKMEMSDDARFALARALGEPADTPLGPMIARFKSLPSFVKAGIYRRGGAQFMGGVEGAKLLESVSKDKEDAFNARSDELASMVATGKIQVEKDEKGKPLFFHESDDPLLPGKKIRKPLNELQSAWLKHSMETGRMPNPYAEDTTTASLAPKRQQSAEEFQKVLDARAFRSDDVDRFQAQLNQQASPASVVSDLAGVSTDNPPVYPHTPIERYQPDPALRVRRFVEEGGLQNVANETLSGAKDFMGALTEIPKAPINMLSNSLNTMMRIGGGAQAPQIPHIPYMEEMPPPAWQTPVSFDDPETEAAKRMGANVASFLSRF